MTLHRLLLIVTVVVFCTWLGLLVVDIRRAHTHKVDPDLSAYIGAPACPCGQYVFDESSTTQQPTRFIDRYRRRCNEEDEF